MKTSSSAANTTTSAPWPDLPAMLHSWAEGKLPVDDRARAIARDAWQAGMQLIEQGGADAVHWLSLTSGVANQMSRLALTCADKAAAAEDATALWAAELEWMSESARRGNASAQEFWAMLIDHQSRFARDWVAQCNQNANRLWALFSGLGGQSGVRIDPASETPVITADAFAPFVDWMAQATEAATQALVRAASHDEPPGQARAEKAVQAGTATRPPRRGRAARHAI